MPDTESVWAYGIETIACGECREFPPDVDVKIARMRGK